MCGEILSVFDMNTDEGSEGFVCGAGGKAYDGRYAAVHAKAAYHTVYHDGKAETYDMPDRFDEDFKHNYGRQAFDICRIPR